MTGRRDLFEQAMSQGHSAAWDQNWDRALAAYRAALQEFPDDGTALTSFGFALLQADRLDDALRAYQRAASLTPGDPVAPEKCGEIFERLGRLTEAAQTYIAVAEIHLTRRDVPKAIDNWNRVVRLTPDNLAAHSRLARALENTQKPREAAVEYVEVARLFQRANDNEKAMQAAAYAAKLDPHLPLAREAIERLRRGQPIPLPERPKSPTGSLRPATGMLGPLPTLTEEPAVVKGANPLAAAREIALGRLAEMLFEEDTDTSKTAASLGAVTRGTGPLRASPAKRAQGIMYLGQAISNQTNGNFDAAINNYESVIESGLNHPAVHFALGALYLDKRSNKAIEHLNAAAGYESLSLGAHFGLGQAYLREGKNAEALRELLQALKALDLQLIAPARRDALAETYENFIDAMLRAAPADAAKISQSILQFLSGDDWEDKAKRSRQQLDSSAEDGQVTALADMLAMPGADKVLDAMRRIEDYMKRKYWASAMEEAYLALDFAPTHLPIHVRMAEILMAESKTPAAVLKYIAVANAYRARGDNARAGKMMQEVLRLNPMDVKVRAELIDILTAQGKLDETMGQYLDLADTYYQLADLDTAKNTYQTALRVAQRSSVNRQWSVRILAQLGDIEMQRLNWRDALRIYEQMKTLAPDDPQGHAALVDLHFRMGNSQQAVAELDSFVKHMQSLGQGAQAIPALEELAQNQSGNPAVHLRLGQLYQGEGRKPEAIAQYEAAADAQLNAGENAQAIQTIRGILALHPDNAAEYEQLLTQIQG
jgi:tetratricopeptide (TPR) repeat protein